LHEKNHWRIKTVEQLLDSCILSGAIIAAQPQQRMELRFKSEKYR